MCRRVKRNGRPKRTDRWRKPEKLAMEKLWREWIYLNNCSGKADQEMLNKTKKATSAYYQIRNVLVRKKEISTKTITVV